MVRVLFVCWGNICRSPMADTESAARGMRQGRSDATITTVLITLLRWKISIGGLCATVSSAEKTIKSLFAWIIRPIPVNRLTTRGIREISLRHTARYAKAVRAC